MLSEARIEVFIELQYEQMTAKMKPIMSIVRHCLGGNLVL